jgi:hypothetical protein
MTVITRVAIASFDDVVGSAEVNVPDAVSVQVAWSRPHQSCAVMGLFDEDGHMVDVVPDVLARLTGLLARPVSAEALRWVFPDADLSSGSVLLSVSVLEVPSAVFASNVRDALMVGDRVPDEVVRDAVWLLLDALSLPAGAIRLERSVLIPELPGDGVYAIAELFERSDRVGGSVPWARASAGMPPVVAGVLSALAGVLAERAEQFSGAGTVLTDVTVPL